MKNFIIVLICGAFVFASGTSMASDKKKSRIGGITKSDHRSKQSSNRQSSNYRSNHRSNYRSSSNHSGSYDNRGYRGSSHSSHGSNHHNYKKHHSYKSPKHHYYSRWRGYGHHSYANYNRYYYRPRHHVYHNHTHTRRCGHLDEYGYLLGGIVLGSAISNARHREYDRSTRVVTTRVVREGSYARRDDIHFFRDRNGNCFEVRYNRDGDEIREEIDPSYCEW